MLDPRLPVAIFLHGFLSSSDSEAALEVTKALVARGGLNVLALDASDFIEKYYVRSATCVRFIGEDLGKLIVQFVKCKPNFLIFMYKFCIQIAHFLK